MKLADEEQLLQKAGMDCEVLDSGCCGMAGSFGFEAEHYEVSVAVGELVLLPAVRRAPRHALIVADGFSCQEQILQTTDRRALHLAQVIQMALHDGPAGPSGDFPEARCPYDGEAGPGQRSPALSGAALALGTAALLAGGLLLWRLTMREPDHERQTDKRQGPEDVRPRLRNR